MHKGKTGILLIILGNILYLAYTLFCGNEVTPFSEFSSGLLLGLSIGINLIGIILLVLYISKNEKNKWLYRKERRQKMYKTVVIDYSPKADNMAQKVEEKANEMLENGYELVTMSITGTAKAILIFKK